VDVVYAVLFLFGDLPARTTAFYKSGWRELLEETDRQSSRYGSDPTWDHFFVGRDLLLKKGAATFGLTPAEQADPKSVPYWPTPARMLAETSDLGRRDFMQYLTDWYYRSFSQDAHFAWAGIARTLPFLSNDSELPPDALEIARARQVTATLTLMLCLVTELELELRFGLADRIRYAWTSFNTWSNDAPTSIRGSISDSSAPRRARYSEPAA